LTPEGRGRTLCGRHSVWSRRQWAHSGGVLHPFEPVQSRVPSSLPCPPPPVVPRPSPPAHPGDAPRTSPRQPVQAVRSHAVPCSEPQRRAAAGRWGRRLCRRRGTTAGGGVRLGGRRENAVCTSYPPCPRQRRRWRRSSKKTRGIHERRPLPGIPTPLMTVYMQRTIAQRVSLLGGRHVS
jgi:hypothetical protein